MTQYKNIKFQEETNLKRVADLFLRNYKIFVLCILITVGASVLYNYFAIPVYSVSSSILIKENETYRINSPDDFLQSDLFGGNQNLQNELWVLKSSPTIDQTIRNLDLSISYFLKKRMQYYNSYEEVPFRVSYLSDHPQPLNALFKINFKKDGSFLLIAESKDVSFYNFGTNTVTHKKDKWIFAKNARVGELIETPDLAFIIRLDSTKATDNIENTSYGFKFRSVPSIRNSIKNDLEFRVVDRAATVIEIALKSESVKEGVDFVDELMRVYSQHNLDRKNHIASITIDYIEKQLEEIADSLNLAEDNLQNFRSSNLLLNINDQATGISSQYMELQNRLAEMISQKKYYDYVSVLLESDNFSNMMLPASIGISDQLLNRLMADLITAQSQRSNLIENKQERNPLVQSLGIQIDNLKKTISDNIESASNTISISIEDMNKQIRRIEGQISQLPATQRKLGTIERKYRLNDAIYNYLLEKRAEANIAKASNLPDNLIIEPAKMVGNGPIEPNKNLVYLFGLFLGLALPYGFLILKSVLNNKIETQDDIEKITDIPTLGVILHNSHKSNNIVFEFPTSNISESFRALRANLDFYVRGGQKKVIMVTSCLEHEGKSFISQNLGMSYAQLGRKTIILDFDLRKTNKYFQNSSGAKEGLSSFLSDHLKVDDIIIKSLHEKLDYVISGITPPNPAELLATEKTHLLIEKIKEKYDIIILDTPPLAQVTDAYLIINYADLKLVITRSKVTLKRVLSLIMKDLNHKSVSNVGIVLNDNRIFSDQYGYGYGYYNDKKKRWMKMKK